MKNKLLIFAGLLSAIAGSKLNAYCVELIGNKPVKVLILKSKQAWDDLKTAKQVLDVVERIGMSVVKAVPGAGQVATIAQQVESGVQQIGGAAAGKSLLGQDLLADFDPIMMAKGGIKQIQEAIVRVGPPLYLTPGDLTQYCYDWDKILTTRNRRDFIDITQKVLGVKDAELFRAAMDYQNKYGKFNPEPAYVLEK